MPASTDNGGAAGSSAGGNPEPRLADVMAALGSVLFRWSLLEAALGEGTKPGGALQGDINHLRKQRNIIVHGLVSVSVDPETGISSVTCRRNRNPAAPQKLFSLPDLRAMAQAMDTCRLRLRRSR